MVSLWETALKHGLGRLAIAPEPVAHAFDRNGVAMLALGRHHCFAVAGLPHHNPGPYACSWPRQKPSPCGAD